VRFIAGLRDRFVENPNSIVLNAVIGPRGDAYRPEAKIAMDAAEEYFAEQLGWLAGTEADMVTALTFNQASEAAGLVRAARSAGPPVVVVHRRDQRRLARRPKPGRSNHAGR
jgi:S-methylmethionine-dependent homocysteine/selenocysteine methylase